MHSLLSQSELALARWWVRVLAPQHAKQKLHYRPVAKGRMRRIDNVHFPLIYASAQMSGIFYLIGNGINTPTIDANRHRNHESELRGRFWEMFLDILHEMSTGDVRQDVFVDNMVVTM